MRDNERLAIEAQAGSMDAAEQLYRENLRLMYKLCSPYVRPRYPVEDLMQEAFFALLSAIKAYDAERGIMFSTYLSRSVQWRLNRYISRHMKQDRREVDILDSPVSRDEPDGETVGDLTPDERAEFEEAVGWEIDYSDMFQEAKRVIAAKYPDEAERAGRYFRVVYDRYASGLSYGKIAEKENCTAENVRQMLSLSLRALRSPKNKKLRNLYDAYISDSIRHSGLSEFKNTFTSGVEWAVMKREIAAGGL